MKTSMTRVMVVAFAMAALGGMSMAPRLSYGLNAADQDPRVEENINGRKAYQDAYNRAYERAKADEAAKLAEEDTGKEEGGCCGGS